MTLTACADPNTQHTAEPNFVQPESTSSETTPSLSDSPLATHSASPSASPKRSASPSSSAKPKHSASPSVKATNAAPGTYTYPVAGHSSYARVHHDYPASDIMARCGTKVVATTNGTIIAVNRKDRWNPRVNAGATRGGLFVSILGDDGVRYYGSHLSVINPEIQVGVRVKSGQAIAKVGDSGDASACHLHYGISPPCAKQGDWWIQRGTIWPWPYLDSWRNHRQKSAVNEVKAWKGKHGCPKSP